MRDSRKGKGGYPILQGNPESANLQTVQLYKYMGGTTDEFFEATGPGNAGGAGFLTSATAFSTGGDFTGNQLGVKGTCQGPVGNGVEGHASGAFSGVAGFGGPDNGTGVFGSGPGFGVRGVGSRGFEQFSDGVGVDGFSPNNVGVQGKSQQGDGVVGRSDAQGKSGVFGFNSFGIDPPQTGFAFGVFGSTPGGIGVGGRTDKFIGVHGVCVNTDLSNPGTAVLGQNENNGTGVEGTSVVGTGVSGKSNLGDGVHGTSKEGDGVHGESDTGVGVVAMSNSPRLEGLFASNSGGGLAAFLGGHVLVEGNFTVIQGLKSAAVPHPDGSHRLLYRVESPESWFEDFGEGQLVDGKVQVQLDPDFAALVEVNGYHVFVTPYGESKGLFVAERHATGFRVCEQQGGTSNVSFAYRVVAKRKDIVADRLAKMTLPERPSKVRSIERQIQNQ